MDPESFFLTEGFSVLLADELTGSEGVGWALADVSAIQPDYFQSAGIPLLGGRGVDGGDGLASDRVAVIDQHLAERFWTLEEAVGQRIWFAGAWRQVVGVATHARRAGPRDEARPQLYLPYSQVGSGRVSVIIDATGDVTTLGDLVRRELEELAPLVPMSDVRPLSEIVDRATSRERFSTLLMTLFAGTAVLLAALGLYGTLSFAARERTREIAVRLVNGSTRGGVARMVVGEGLKLAGAGLAVGLAGALALGRLADDLLFGISPHDPVTLGLATGLVVLVATAASSVPALRAVSIDAARALRPD